MIRPLKPLLFWAAAAVLAGCAGGPRALTTAEVRAQLPALEARAEAAPRDADALRELGRAYARLGAYDQARSALEQARRLDPSDPATAYTLGLVGEAQDRPVQAIAQYRAVQGDRTFGLLAAGRRERLERRAVRAEIDSLLDADALRPTREGVVAVFPFQVRGGAGRQPLGRALTALIADDLTALGLRVVAPERVQATLDALGLEPDDVGPARARRLARVLQADHVAIGTLTLSASSDSAQADIVLWDGTATPPPVPVNAAGAVAGLADVGAALVAALAEQRGVPVPRAGRSPRDAGALLLFGRGLLEEDAGRYSEAATLYEEAARLDPSFDLAAGRSVAARAAASSSGGVSSALAAADGLGRPPASARLLGSRLAHVTESLGVHAAPPETRDPAAEVPLAPPATPLPPPPAPPGGQQTP